MSRDLRFGLVLSEEEKNALVQLAELAGGFSQAAFLRSLIRDAARKEGIWPRPIQRVELKRNKGEWKPGVNPFNSPDMGSG